jgi:RNA polymerase sigma-70 factor (ECF subfamily)
MPESAQNDLIHRLRKGERQALEEFYDQYSPVVLSVCMRYLNSREDAEDVMHDSLLKILKGIEKFDPRFSGSFEVWMRRIAANTSLNFLRVKHLQQPLSRWQSETIADNDNDSEDYLPDEIDPVSAVGMIGELPDGYRMVLNLYVFEDYSHKEIASQLGITESTSKSQLSKARALLRKKLQKYCNLNQVAKL